MNLIKFIVLLSMSPLAFGAETYGPYRAEVVRVKDGDTVLLDIHVWPSQRVRTSLRVDGVDTPEKRGHRDGAPIPECEKALARAASDFTGRVLPIGKDVTVTGIHPGKYAGRVLGGISIDGEDLGGMLIEAGHARPYDGRKRMGWCQ